MPKTKMLEIKESIKMRQSFGGNELNRLSQIESENKKSKVIDGSTEPERDDIDRRLQKAASAEPSYLDSEGVRKSNTR